MRRPIRPPDTKVYSVPAPVGGWDAQSALADMPEDRAVILDNFIPRPGFIELRRGSAAQVPAFADGTPSTMMVWRGSAEQLLACVGGKIYDVTTPSLTTPAPIYSGASSNAWEYVNFANSAGTWVAAVNGVDSPIKYDGTTVTTTTFTYAGAPPPAFDQTKLSLIMAHKRRLHMGEKNSLRVWFASAVDAIAGPVGLLDLGPVFDKGGVLVAIGTTSLNYGTGLDDFAIYVTSQGQIAMYQGLDPGDATSWALVGVYNVGYPMGPRSLVKWGADLAIITTDGVVPLSQAIKLDRAQDDLVAITQRIQNAFHTATSSYPPGTTGWQGLLYPKGGYAIINVPAAPAVQYVQVLQNGSWCRFTGLSASCWAVANNNIYYAANSKVYQFDLYADDDHTLITYDLKTAFNAFKAAGQKQFKMVRTLMTTPGFVQPAIEVDADYSEVTPTAVPTVVDPSSLTAMTRYDWSSATAIGFVGAVRMQITPSVVTYALAVDSGDVDEVGDGLGNGIATGDQLPVFPFQLTGFDVLYERGGVL